MLYSAVIIIYPSVEYMKYDVWGFYEAKELKEVYFFVPPSSELDVSVPNK